MTFSNFHTTALCSPTRASLLTGRNATSNGMATIAEFASGFPGISTRIPFENGFISEVLAEQGYNTYCVGKWHLTPGEECNLAAYKGRWPLGRGFERFYGWLGGETNSYFPDLVHDNHPIEPPARPEDGYHLADDMAEKAVEFIQDAKVIDPDKPFFMYLAPQAGHAPHLVPLEWADRYKGVFDQGYEAIRDGHPGPPDRARPAARGHGALAHQPPRRARSHRPRRPALAAARHRAALGLADRGRAEAVRPDGRGLRRLHLVLRRPPGQGARLPRGVRASSTTRSSSWCPTTAPAARAAPTAASTSGGSSTASPTRSRPRYPHIDELGTPASNNHYNTGWAWALDTPFPYWKRWAGAEGGTADMCIVAWPAKIAASKEIRHQYVHAVDVVPTIYDLLGIEPPEVLKGYPQSPIEGESFAAALTDPTVPGKRTQFYTMLGQRSIYHDGWLACTVHPPLSSWGNFGKDEWELFHLETDRSQSTNVAADHPEKLEELKGLWFYYAGIYNGLPVDDRNALEQVLAERPHGAPDRDQYVFYPVPATSPSPPARSSPGARTRSPPAWTSTSADVEGVIWAAGGVPGGHSLYVKDGSAPLHVQLGRHHPAGRGRATADLAAGTHVCVAEFAASGPSTDPAMPGTAGTLTLYVDDQQVGQGQIVTQPGYFCLTGDGICVGRDSASAVTPEYQAPFPFTGGTIDKVVVDVSGEGYADHEEKVRAWFGID